MDIAGEYENSQSWVAEWPHCWILQDTPAMICDASKGSKSTSRSLKSQQITLFHRNVWPGLYMAYSGVMGGKHESFFFSPHLSRGVKLGLSG